MILHFTRDSAKVHYMSDSAIGGMEARRQETRRQITRSARELALQHGLDGFTMDHLAEASGVSRRTLFNYFPGKYDALLGGGFHIDAGVSTTFCAGGPSGNLIEDLLVVAEHVLSERDETPEDSALGRRVIMECPALAVHASSGLDQVLAEFVEHIRGRTDVDVSARAARGLLTTLLALIHLSIDDFVESGGSTPPGALLRQYVTDLRHLLN